MKNLLRILTALAIGMALSVLHAGESKNSDDMNAGIIYGKDHAFSLSAPEGWVLDNSSGVKQGVYAVFYPKGGAWEKSPVTMYVNTAKPSPGETIDDFIKADLEQMKKGSPGIVMTTGSSIETWDKKVASVRYFTGDKWGNYEAVAYLQEETVFVLIALSARNRELYEGALEAFQKLVKSYHFLSKNVEIRR